MKTFILMGKDACIVRMPTHNSVGLALETDVQNGDKIYRLKCVTIGGTPMHRERTMWGAPSSSPMTFWCKDCEAQVALAGTVFKQVY